MSAQNNIEEELRNLNSSLAEISREMPYQVPLGYFEELTDDLVSIPVAMKFEETYSKHENPLTVPAGYFNTLPDQLLEAAKNGDSHGKRNVVPQRVAFRPQLQWAAAAVITLIISLGGYIIFSGGNGYTQPERMLSSISGSDISEYVQHSYGLDAGKVINNSNIGNLNVDNQDIVQYLNEMGWE